LGKKRQGIVISEVMKTRPNTHLATEQMIPDFFGEDGGGRLLRVRVVFKELREAQNVIGELLLLLLF
jgi:hypothetical protein